MVKEDSTPPRNRLRGWNGTRSEMTTHVRLPTGRPRFSVGDWVQIRNSEFGSIENIHPAGVAFCYDICVGRCIRDGVSGADLTLLARDEE
jgi:hypothetical protein